MMNKIIFGKSLSHLTDWSRVILSLALILFSIALVSCVDIANNSNAKEVQTENEKQMNSPQVIALKALNLDPNQLNQVAEIALPQPIKQLFPHILYFAVTPPFNSEPPTWSRIAVNQENQATYIIELFGAYPDGWKKNLQELLNLQESRQNQNIEDKVRQNTVIATFFTHTLPQLVNWNALNSIITDEDFSNIVQQVKLQQLDNGNYQTTINLEGTTQLQDSDTATISLTYQFDRHGNLIDIQKEYKGPYFL